ncbi:MAG: autotransporter outer membrane beta-barrel domain-containing protein [Acetobacteraceae bacterium]
MIFPWARSRSRLASPSPNLHASQSAFTESGASILDLSYDATSSNTVFVDAAVRVARSFVSRGELFTPRAEIGIQQVLAGARPEVTVRDGLDSALEKGIGIAPISALLGAGVAVAVNRNFSGLVGYRGTLSGRETGSRFVVGLRYTL